MIENSAFDKPNRILFKAGGWTSVLFIFYSIATILILVLLDGGYPDSALKCFEMIHENKFLALIQLDIISVIVVPFYYLLFFCLYQALKEGYELISKIALFLTLAGITVFVSGINLASILHLCDKYYAASSPELRNQLLAACEGMLAADMWVNTGAIIRGILIESGAVIFSVIMLKTAVFGKAAGWVGFFTHGFDLASVVIGLFYAPMKIIFTMIAGPLYFVWFIMIGIRLFQLGRKKI